MVSVGQEFSSVLNGQFSLRIPNEIVVRCWLSLQLSLGLIGMEDSFPRCLISHVWQISVSCWLGNSASLRVDVSSELLSVLTTWWLAFPIMHNSKYQGWITNAVCDLATEVTYHYSHHILLVTQPTLIQCVKNYRGIWIQGGMIVVDHGLS